MAAIREWIYTLCDEYRPMTVRQLFYALTVRGVIEKTEAEYKGTVCRLTKDMRLSGVLPWDWLSDHTRWMHKPNTFGGISDCLEQSQRSYRRALWDPSSNPDYVEVWLEKDALTGVFFDVTEKFDVPLMPCRGYPSLSFLRAAAETIHYNLEARALRHSNAKAVIYYFGDFDPSGVDISRATNDRLRQFLSEFGSGLELFSFQRVAVNHDQIQLFNLPTRPTKCSDTRSKHFGHDVSVELDAIDPPVLKQMIGSCIQSHLDQHQLQNLRDTEHHERRLLQLVTDFARIRGSDALADRLLV